MRRLSLIALVIFSVPSFALGDCYQFFYVKRPVVAGAVQHEFVVAQSEDLKSAYALGLLKGDEDLKYFLRAQRDPNEYGIDLRLLGASCGENGEKALREAQNFSRQWMEFYQNLALYLARMGATPVMGKPCRNTALAIEKLIEPYLE